MQGVVPTDIVARQLFESDIGQRSYVNGIKPGLENSQNELHMILHSPGDADYFYNPSGELFYVVASFDLG